MSRRRTHERLLVLEGKEWAQPTEDKRMDAILDRAASYLTPDQAIPVWEALEELESQPESHFTRVLERLGSKLGLTRAWHNWENPALVEPPGAWETLSRLISDPQKDNHGAAFLLWLLACVRANKEVLREEEKILI